MSAASDILEAERKSQCKYSAHGCEPWAREVCRRADFIQATLEREMLGFAWLDAGRGDDPGHAIIVYRDRLDSRVYAICDQRTDPFPMDGYDSTNPQAEVERYVHGGLRLFRPAALLLREVYGDQGQVTDTLVTASNPTAAPAAAEVFEDLGTDGIGRP